MNIRHRSGKGSLLSGEGRKPRRRLNTPAAAALFPALCRLARQHGQLRQHRQKKILFLASLLLFSFLGTLPLPAFRYPDRDYRINMLADAPEDSEWHFADRTAGAGLFGYYTGSDPEHLWNVRLGVRQRFLRYDNDFALIFQADNELVSNDKSEINFNPRAVFWQEGFMGWWQTEGLLLGAGLLHRCKHEIDNLAIGYQRVLVYSSLRFAFHFQNIPLVRTAGFLSRFSAGMSMDFYVYTLDERSPDTYRERSIEYWPFSLDGFLDLTLFRAGKHGVYLLVNLQILPEGAAESFAGSWNIKRAHFSGSAEAGWRFRGLSGTVEIFLQYAHLHDDGIRLPPGGSSTWFLGLRVTPGY